MFDFFKKKKTSELIIGSPVKGKTVIAALIFKLFSKPKKSLFLDCFDLLFGYITFLRLSQMESPSFIFCSSTGFIKNYSIRILNA